MHVARRLRGLPDGGTLATLTVTDDPDDEDRDWYALDAMAPLDVEGDGRDELLLASGMGFRREAVTCVDVSSGDRRWTWTGWRGPGSDNWGPARILAPLVDLDGDGIGEVFYAAEAPWDLRCAVLSGRTGAELARFKRLGGREVADAAVSSDGTLVAFAMPVWNQEGADEGGVVEVYAAEDLLALGR